MTEPRRSRRLAGEALGTAFLLAIVVGSGIMGERLCGGNVAIALLANSIATGAGLVALILAFGHISGAHLNPVVSLVEASRGSLAPRDAIAYIVAQAAGLRRRRRRSRASDVRGKRPGAHRPVSVAAPPSFSANS